MIWSFGEFEVDADRYELRRQGDVVELRPKVLDVLLYLVRHNDRLVSKDELLRNLWPGETIHEGVLPQNIALLRKLVGDTRDQANVIQTVHGRGYRFVAKVMGSGSVRPPPRDDSRVGSAQLPFVGRDRVLETLRTALDDAFAGRGRFAVVIGEAGIGKTRTLEAIAQEAAAAGARVLEARCHESHGAPAYFPWVQMLRAAQDHIASSQGVPGATEAGHLLGELSRDFGGGGLRAQPLDSAQARFRLFDGVASYFAKLARVQPLVLIFDDLHWADEATLLLLRFLAREARALPLLLLGTSRELDVQAHSSAAALLAELTGGAHVERIYLRGLTHADTAALAAAVLQRDLDQAEVDELQAVTEGNPFFVHEVLRLLAADVRTVNGSGARRELPRRLREVIGLRLRSLPAEAQHVLSLASVLGQEFRVAVLAQLADTSSGELLALLAQAVRARLLREVDADKKHNGDSAGARFEFAHALIHETLYEALAESERVRLHAEAGRALEALFGVDAEEHASELAYHFYRAASGGGVDKAVAYCARAGAQALDLLAFEPAVLQYQRALEALACKLPIDETRRFELKLALGGAMFRAEKDGNPALLGAAEIARRLGRPELLAQVVLAMRGWPRTGYRGRTVNRELLLLLTEALAEPIAHGKVMHARLLSIEALNAARGVTLEERIAISQRGLELARQTGDDEALYDALQARLQLMHAPENAALRLSLASDLLELARRSGQRERIFTAHELCVQPLLALGDLTLADREIARCAELADEMRLPRCKLQVLRFRMERALGDGRFEEIGPLTEEAVRVGGRGSRSAMYMVSVFAWVFFTKLWQGDFRGLEADLAWMVGGPRPAPLPASLVALCRALAGRHDEARASYLTVLDASVLDGPRDDNWLSSLVLTADAATICRDQGAAERLYSRILPYAALNVAHPEMMVYFGSCAHWLGDLAMLLGDPQSAAEHFEAALEMNTRLQARPAVARTSLSYARLLLGQKSTTRRKGNRDAQARAQRLLRSALRIGKALDMGWLVAQARELTDG